MRAFVLAATVIASVGGAAAAAPLAGNDPLTRDPDGVGGNNVERRLTRESLAEPWQREGEFLMPIDEPEGTSPTKTLDYLGRRLGLTAEQQEKIRRILNRKVLRVREVARNLVLTAQQKREKGTRVVAEEYDKIRALLTEEQRAVFDRLRK